MLGLSGTAQLLNPSPSAVETLHGVAFYVWGVTLVLFGTLGVLSMLLPFTGQRIVGLGLEVICRLVLGLATLVYGLSVFLVNGTIGRFVTLTYIGMTLLLWVGAYQITRWLAAQRHAVEAFQEEKAP